MKEQILNKGDKAVAYDLMREFGIKQLLFDMSNSTKKWPDIWVVKSRPPVITVTKEWARQGKDERRKRLTHEFLHLNGLEHNEKLGYSTIPAKDSYSMSVYRILKRKYGWR